MAEQDSSTRTIAGVAAVVAILALLVGVVESSRSGILAQYVGTAKAVSENNDKAMMGKIDALSARIDGLEKQVADAKAAAEAAAAKTAQAEPAEEAPTATE